MIPSILLMTTAFLVLMVGISWHPPDIQEHGDPPPQWAVDWAASNNLGSIVYGGDESTGPAENTVKHPGYKGYLMTQHAGPGVGYLRVHAMSNAMDRCSQYHSFESYWRDSQHNVSFWQGWYDIGDPMTRRVSRTVNPSADGLPIVLVVDQPAWDALLRDEIWYPEPRGGMTPYGRYDLALFIRSTTIYPGTIECAGDPSNMSSWIVAPDNNKGLIRGAEWFWYPPRNMASGPYCTLTDGQVVPCNTPGSLRQIVASTLYADLVNDGSGPRILGQSAQINICPTCILPN